MNDTLAITYISTLLFFLFGIAIFVLIQIIKTRRVEGKFSRLQNKLKKEKGTAKEYYDLGSIFLDKKLFSQAIASFEKALKVESNIEPENKALIYNALGYSYFAKEQYDVAIRQYKEALKLYPEYVTAMTNLANVYERKQLTAQALEMYDKALEYDPKNAGAKRRGESLRKRLVTSN